jgi:flagellar hook-associated protein 2
MSSGISFSGLGSGVDTNSIVTQLMQLERAPISKIQRDKTAIQTKQSVIQELNTLLKTLRDKASALKDATNFNVKTATTSDPLVASATTTNLAATGSYNVSVTALSKAHTMASALPNPVMSDDTLHITVGATTVDVAALATDSLQGLADKINSATNTPVAASVINDKLVLISKTTGAAGGMTVTSDAALAGALGLAETQPAQDSQATVNGLVVTGSGNTISGAIAGVTLNLSKLGDTTVNVGLDGASVEGKVKEFVEAYNALINNIAIATKYDVASKGKGALQGDQSLSSFLGQLRGIASSAVTSLTGTDSLAQIGITTNPDRSGKLVLNSGVFQTALKANPSAVADVFGKDDGVSGSGSGDGIAYQFHALADSFSSDVMAGRLKGFTDRLGRMDKKIADLEVLMDLREKTMRAKFAAMEKAVSSMKSQGADLAARLGTG